MAKSTRSKVKRSFRAKKRTDGVYAAVEAARLNRLHNRLKAIATTELDVADEEGDEMEEGARMETEGDAAAAGWSPFWLAGLALVDAQDITADGMADFLRLGAGERTLHTPVPGKGARKSKRRSRATVAAETETKAARAPAGDACGLDHLFPSLPSGSGCGISG